MNYSTVNCSILQENIVVYHKKNVLLQSVIFYHRMWYNSIGYTITNSSILLQSYHRIEYFTIKCDIIPHIDVLHLVWYISHGFHYTTIDIVPQSVAFLLQSVVFPINYPKTNCSIVLQNIIVYHKNI